MMRPTTTKQRIAPLCVYLVKIRPKKITPAIKRISTSNRLIWSQKDRLAGCSLYIMRSTGTSATTRIVSAGHSTLIWIVSWMRLILIWTPSRTISRAIVSRTINVSRNVIASVTIVVSTLTIVSASISGSFAIARFR